MTLCLHVENKLGADEGQVGSLGLSPAAKLLQCPALCDPMDVSPPGSSVHGILQAQILEWVAMSFSRGYS